MLCVFFKCNFWKLSFVILVAAGPQQVAMSCTTILKTQVRGVIDDGEKLKGLQRTWQTYHYGTRYGPWADLRSSKSWCLQILHFCFLTILVVPSWKGLWVLTWHGFLLGTVDLQQQTVWLSYSHRPERFYLETSCTKIPLRSFKSGL